MTPKLKDEKGEGLEGAMEGGTCWAEKPTEEGAAWINYVLSGLEVCGAHKIAATP